MHVLPDISRSKNSQKTMKFGQLIEHQREKYFSSKVMQKLRQGDYFCYLQSKNFI